MPRGPGLWSVFEPTIGDLYSTIATMSLRLGAGCKPLRLCVPGQASPNLTMPQEREADSLVQSAAGHQG